MPFRITGRIRAHRFRRIRLELLEPRLTLSAADVLSFPHIVDQVVLGGAPTWLGIDATDTDPNGGPLTYSVSISNATSASVLQAIIPTGNNSLVINTSGDEPGVTGQMTFQLFDNLVPHTTQHIEALVNDGELTGNASFYRISYSGEQPFVIQGGPASQASSLGQFDDEYNPDLQFTSAGLLAMAKSTNDTSDDQIFVTANPARFLDFNYSIFGVVTAGESVRQAIQNANTSGDGPPPSSITIESAQIITDTQNAALELKAPVGASGSADVTLTVSDQVGHRFSQQFHVNVAPDPNNPGPFLNPIPVPIVGVQNQPIYVQLSATDVQQKDPDYFDALKVAGETLSYSLDVDHQTGLATITPPEGFIGSFNVEILVRGSQTRTTYYPYSPAGDTQVVTVTVNPPGFSVDLSAESDSGDSDTDNITNAASMDFDVTDTTTGALVSLFVDGMVAAEATATGPSIRITTSAVSAAGDGQHLITATQTVNGVESDPTPALLVTYDSTPPQFISTPPPTAFNNSDYDYVVTTTDAEAVDYSLLQAPSGAATFGNTVEWDASSSAVGTQVNFSIQATDIAGNSSVQQFNVLVVAPHNDPPVAMDDNYASTVNEPIITYAFFGFGNVGVLYNDYDPNLDSLTASLQSPPTYGSIDFHPDGSFTYQPNPGFTGDDSFTYIASDPYGGNSQATVTLHITAPPPPPTTEVAFTLQLTQPNGSPLTSVDMGQSFVLHVMVQDLRPNPDGVFAAYLDLNWDPAKAAVTGPIHHGADYRLGRDQQTTGPGFMNNAGAFTSIFSGLGSGPLELFSVPMKAIGAGDFRLTASPADDSPLHDVVFFDSSVAPPDEIDYGMASITVDPPPPGVLLLNHTLLITGSDQRDQLTVKSSYHLLTVSGTIGGTHVNQSFQTASVHGLVANLGDGDDSLKITGSKSLPVFVDAGDGNDVVSDSAGAAILVGGDGDDRLTGSSSRDLLIGGNGRDVLTGGGGEDILIDGTTAYDHNLAALLAIEVQWLSPTPRAQRMADIAGGTGSFVSPLGVSLQPGVTVFNDGDVDQIFGDSSDWIFSDAASDRVNLAQHKSAVRRY
jgi:cyclophilin family peptidyl-prolyl cis-trans isomerase